MEDSVRASGIEPFSIEVDGITLPPTPAEHLENMLAASEAFDLEQTLARCEDWSAAGAHEVND